MRNKSNLAELLTYAGRYKILIVLSWVFAILSAFIALIPFVYIWKVVEEIIAVAPHFNQATHLKQYGWMGVAAAVLGIVVYIVALLCSHMGAFRVASNIRISLMKHIATLPVGTIEHLGTGKMRKIVNECSSATETYLAHQLPDKAVALATPVGLIFLLFSFDWRLGVLSLIPVILAFLIMMTMVGPKMADRMSAYQNALENMSNEAVEYVRGIPVVKTFGQTVYSFKRFKVAIDNYCEWVSAYSRVCRKSMVGYTVVVNSVFAFLIAGGLYWSQHAATQTFVLNMIFYIIITPIISLTLTKIMFQSENKMIVEDALRRINGILEIDRLHEGQPAQLPKDYGIQLKDVSFSYSKDKEVLQHISLQVQEGKTIALVGPSGGGKTTLGQLVARFFDVTNGRIEIGGVDIRHIPKQQLMDSISFVFQDSHLLKMSIFENVRLGRPQATREEVLEALKVAQCMDIVEKLPNHMDTLIGTKHAFLSGGECQRIAIARAVLKNSPIIVLDEATAFADPDNESKVQQALGELTKGKTVIVIAHRLSTIVGVDEIVVLKDGRIVEQGNHEQLLSKKGMYEKMWRQYGTCGSWKVAKERIG